MSHSHAHESVPRIPLIGAGALVIASLVLVAFVRLVPAPAEVPATTVVSRELHFDDRDDGGITVRDARDPAYALVLPAGQDNFVRATMRGFARERRRAGIGQETPFRLSARSDGRLTLEDPTNGRIVDLEAFGSTNVASFARFLTPPGRVQSTDPTAPGLAR
jgi:putative photosynthetic complex assembly protein